MSLYKMFEVDNVQEQGGVLLNYGDVRFLIARAGGGNKDFAKVFIQRSLLQELSFRIAPIIPKKHLFFISIHRLSASRCLSAQEN